MEFCFFVFNHFCRFSKGAICRTLPSRRERIAINAIDLMNLTGHTGNKAKKFSIFLLYIQEATFLNCRACSSGGGGGG